MKFFPLIPLFLLFFSCNENTTVKESTIEDEPVHDMSIYQLPSVWNTQDGDQIEFKDLKGETLTVVMIYTACRTACPRLVSDMRAIESGVNSNKAKGVKYVLVSIDPKNDTPEKLKAFSIDNGMDGPQWLFLQGTEDSVREFANILAVKYKKISPIDFSHSNIISVFDRNGVMQYQKEGLGLVNGEIVNSILAVAKN